MAVKRKKLLKTKISNKGSRSIIKETGENKMMLYAVAVLGVVLLTYWTIKKNEMYNYAPPVPNPVVEENSYPSMNNSADLDKAIKDLDASDVNVIDKELSGLVTDSSNF